VAGSDPGCPFPKASTGLPAAAADHSGEDDMLGWTDDRYRVERVRAHKRVLSGHMTQKEIAAALGVCIETLRGFAKDPSAGNWRRIPDDKLDTLRGMALAHLEQDLEAYRAAA
jgi:hypothetical protein